MKPSDDMGDKIALMMIEKGMHTKLTPMEFCATFMAIYKATEVVLSFYPDEPSKPLEN